MIWLISLLVGAAAAIVLVSSLEKPPQSVAVATRPAPLPQTLASAASQPASQPAGIRTYGQVLHADLKNYPDTQPWAWNVEMNDAAHVVLNEPVYVCPRGDLWITRADADPLLKVLARAADETEHVVDQTPRYIVWTVSGKHQWQASAVCGDDEHLELVSPTDRKPIPWHRNYRWLGAMNWADGDATRLIVPTDRGISIITIDSTLTESYCELTDAPAASAPATIASNEIATTSSSTTNASTIASTVAGIPIPPPQVLFDTRGLLAWIPSDGDFRGPSHVARFVDGKWTTLDSVNWPDGIIHLVPMLDGSVLQIRHGIDPGSVTLSTVLLESAPIDQKEVIAMANQLGDEDPDNRIAAFERLTQFGPGINSILEKIEPTADVEAKSRIHALIESGIASRLGGMTINDNLLTVYARVADGGVVFFAPHGVSIPQDQQDPKIVSPDYLVVRPGRAVRELPAAIIEQLDGTKTLAAIKDEWILTGQNSGPRRYLSPNQFYQLLRPSETKFSSVFAIDGRGRWLLRGQGNATTQPTLIIDPTIPDPTIRLAIWMIDTGQDVGWNKTGWPVLLRGATHWVVNNRDWEVMDEKTDEMLEKLPATVPSIPANAIPASMPSATAAIPASMPTSMPTAVTLSPPSSLATSLPTSMPGELATTLPDAGPLLLTDAAGNRYYDGESTLTVIDAAGNPRAWTLPDECAGDREQPAWLAPDRNGHLYLFNTAGKIIRLRPTPGEAQPFVVESIFTKDIPNFREIRRIWLDPGGRIDVGYEQWRLAIIFPTGQISPEIVDRVPPGDVKRTDEP
jgi:hypothetical protein